MSHRWTPVDIKTLLHFYTTPISSDTFNGDHTLDATNLIGAGLVVCDVARNQLQLSDYGLAFIAFLLDLPVPEKQWHLPVVEHKTAGYSDRPIPAGNMHRLSAEVPP